MLQPLTVIGAGAQATVIDVVVADRAFDSHAVPLTLADLAVTGGGTVDEGGAVRATGGHLTLTRARVAGSLATVGAGIFATGPLTLTDTVVEGNAALAAGGGIAAIGPGPVTIQGGVLRGNTSGQWGGGLYSAGPVVLRDVVIEDNHADEAGGGLALDSSASGVAPPGSSSPTACSPTTAASSAVALPPATASWRRPGWRSRATAPPSVAAWR